MIFIEIVCYVNNPLSEIRRKQIQAANGLIQNHFCSLVFWFGLAWFRCNWAQMYGPRCIVGWFGWDQRRRTSCGEVWQQPYLSYQNLCNFPSNSKACEAQWCGCASPNTRSRGQFPILCAFPPFLCSFYVFYSLPTLSFC